MQHSSHAPGPAPTGRPASRTARVAGALVVAAALGLVLLMYRDPDFLVMLSDMIWACFG